MTISFHGGHSGHYCDHAEGKLEDIIKNAITLGFTHYGLSEHMPRSQEKYLYPEEKQKGRQPEQLKKMFELYIEESRQLQYKYRHDIKLLVGMEADWINQNGQEIQSLCQTFSTDFLVGSVHFVEEAPFDYSEVSYNQLEAKLGGTEAVFCAYYDEQYEMMKTLHPQVIGHFDLIRIYRPHFTLTDQIWEKINRNINYGVSYNTLFEINARAFKKGLTEPYPQGQILRQILSCGGKFTLGDDSHHPDQVGLNYDLLFSFLREIEIFEVYALEKTEKGDLQQKQIILGE